MPRPAEGGSAYRPGLDGIRAIAVIGVVLYHVGAPWLPGGLMGVGVFFTLSGYLITSILISRWERYGSLRLGRFWLARARRLLPALFLMLAAVLLAAAWIARDQLDALWREALSAALYVANWTDIYTGDSYFDATAAAGPLDHLWSLAVEEQFYLLWPLLLWGLLWITRGSRKWMVGAILGLGAGSFALLWLLASSTFDNTRAYEGTDTRAGALLIGAALAVAWRGGVTAKPLKAKTRSTSKKRKKIKPKAPVFAPASRWLEFGGAVGLAAVITLMATVDDYSLALYRGGLLGLAVATALLVAAAAHPRSITARVLGVAPLQWIGERSYGIYLWHLPVIALMPERLLEGVTWARALIAAALTVGISALSWWAIENPIRTRGFKDVLRIGAAHIGKITLRAPVAVGAAVVVVAGTAMLASPTGVTNLNPPPPSPSPLPPAPANWPFAALPSVVPLAPPVVEPLVPALAGKTSCTAVLHVGDSTSLGLISKTSLPDKDDRIQAQFERVGITEVRTDILGARSIVEKWHDQPNAQDAVRSAKHDGFKGCYVIAMGLNEAANVAVGGQASLKDRIDKMQHLVGDSPTMWTTVRTRRSDGPWANKEMMKMNRALEEACLRYPNMRVYDWGGEVKNSWFISDDIHYTSQGDREHARRIADALAVAFPAVGPTSFTCMVGSGDD